MTPVKEIIRLGSIEIRFLLDGGDTNGQLSMFELSVPPGAQVPAPHYHEQVDEIVYGLEGVLTFTVDGRKYEMRPGDRCFVPRGAVHHFVNTGPETTRTLAVLTPARIGPAYFRELAALRRPAGPGDPVERSHMPLLYLPHRFPGRILSRVFVIRVGKRHTKRPAPLA
jgi:quercetin dioxygenase-like cupin family protein